MLKNIKDKLRYQHQTNRRTTRRNGTNSKEEININSTKMTTGTAPGYDEVTAEILKYINEERQQEFLDIVNQAKVVKKSTIDLANRHYDANL